MHSFERRHDRSSALTHLTQLEYLSASLLPCRYAVAGSKRCYGRNRTCRGRRHGGPARAQCGSDGRRDARARALTPPFDMPFGAAHTGRCRSIFPTTSRGALPPPPCLPSSAPSIRTVPRPRVLTEQLEAALHSPLSVGLGCTGSLMRLAHYGDSDHAPFPICARDLCTY